MLIKKIFCLLLAIGMSLSVMGAKVDTVTIFSAANQKNIKAAVVLPDTHKKSKSPFTVLYLLHGFSDPFNAWLKLPVPDKELVQKLADKYNLVVVCPDGGFGSWYLDSPVEKQSQYESYIIRELIPHIDKTYKTNSNREGRLISGLSMGGHGALYLAGRNPGLFLAAGSIAGALDLSRSLDNPTIQEWFLKILGNRNQHVARYRDNSVFYMTDKLKTSGLKLIIDCGTNDFLYDVNKDFHQKLLKEGIAHDYTERPGYHNWEYFANALEYHLIFFRKQQDLAAKKGGK